MTERVYFESRRVRRKKLILKVIAAVFVMTLAIYADSITEWVIKKVPGSHAKAPSQTRAVFEQSR